MDIDGYQAGVVEIHDHKTSIECNSEEDYTVNINEIVDESKLEFKLKEKQLLTKLKCFN